MTLAEIRQHCVAQMALGSHEAGFVLPGNWGKRNTKRLWPGGPVGEIVRELPESGVYAFFNASEVITAIDALQEKGERKWIATSL